MFSNPEKNIDALMLMPGMKVVDIGAGSGHYALAAAKAVGGAGKVYAIDIQKDLLTRLKSQATALHIQNIEIVLGDMERVEGSHLAHSLADAAIVANILFQVEHKNVFVAEVRRILKPGGKLMLIDWQGSFDHTGPTPEHIVSEASAKALFEAAGFRYSKGFFAGDHHYGLIFQKNR